MYDLAKLCHCIQMPQPVADIVLSHQPEENTLGFPILREHLLLACQCWEEYQRLGISEEIYIATMACFSRFVREHMVSFGCYGFDRGFWTTRQVCARLFRIGQLEYELLEINGEKKISLHIPSDCLLHTPLLRESWLQAKALIGRIFPEFSGAPWVCSSWLLSPNLKDLLPETSHILQFQQSFVLTDVYAEPEYKEWVFKRTDIPDPELPENTSLQRSIKRFLLSGGIFLCGKGTLIPDPFQ